LWQRIQDRKAIQPGHLDIEEYNVRLQLLNRCNGRRTIFRLAGDLDRIGVGSKQTFEPPSRFALIIHDQRAAFHEWTPTS
jgi:hypothetical protein